MGIRQGELSKLWWIKPEKMVRVIFTLDYEIHGNGDGCPRRLMVEPTDHLLRLFDEYGARLTIMADVGEILKFGEYAEALGRDDYSYGDIIAQLQGAVQRGHDVQLHIHSSYFNARHDGRKWLQDWSEYNFAGLAPERVDHMIAAGKKFLESTLRSVKPDYACRAFRAANWSVSPSGNVVRALLKNDICIDTSVFKYGRRDGIVHFDYAEAHSAMLPWRADDDALWRHDPNGKIWELPIYSEQRGITAFVSSNRIYRVLQGSFHRIENGSNSGHPQETRENGRRSSAFHRLSRLLGRHAWKADFNQCTGRQLIRALQRAEQRHASSVSDSVPFVLIGHSKLFSPWNERSLRPFLSYVAKAPSRFTFGTIDSLALAV
jgi:peptidoglycan/xylan/chitin deacetylase (PgdA/CDA1 family)